jgi:hypothetical protein
MEPKELDRNISQSENKEWFIEKAEISFPLRSSTGNLTKKGLVSIYRYVLDQVNGFDKIGEVLPNELKSSRTYFESFRDEIVSFFNSSHGRNSSQLDSFWQQAIGQVSQKIQREGNKLMDFDSPEVEFLVSLKTENASYVSGALHFLCTETLQSLDRPENLIGAMKAFNYKFENKSGTESKKNSEKISLGILRSSFQKILDEVQNNHLNNLEEENTKTLAFSKAIDTLKEEKESLFDQWYKTSRTEFDDLSKDIDSRKKELEKTYSEIFFLKEPAKYWKDRADELSIDGKKYLSYLYILISIGAISLFILLWQIPDGMLLDIFKGEASAIKWTLVYVTFISFLAFGIKTLSKLTYSTYHLKRDAEERHQLTYLYLSLVNEKKIEDNERHLVLQSLFSRADTGLLKEDSSPTMPGLVDTVFKSGK